MPTVEQQTPPHYYPFPEGLSEEDLRAVGMAYQCAYDQLHKSIVRGVADHDRLSSECEKVRLHVERIRLNARSRTRLWRWWNANFVKALDLLSADLDFVANAAQGVRHEIVVAARREPRVHG